MEPYSEVTSHLVAIPMDNIDTDQIIPARFLKTISKTGLGEHLFSDWRYDADGSPRPQFQLNLPESRGAKILLAGDNFGCGSSREHAPWALMDHGIKVIISTSFADIFRNNSLKNGLLPVEVDAETHRQLFSLAAEDPGVEVTVDLVAQELKLPDGRAVRFPIDGFSRYCLLEGIDQLGYLLKHDSLVAQYERDHRTPVHTAKR
jgi:3-isopropylmalate/(R)-2-methylmalate dehydratase small subunit